MPRLRSNVVALTRPTSAMTTGQALVAPAYAATRLGAAPVQQGDLISARVRAGRFPPPMSRAWVECHSPSDWEVVDTVTPATLALHDDFHQLYYNAGILAADTNWGVNDTSGGAGTITQDTTQSGIGVVRVFTGGVLNNAMHIEKDVGSIKLDDTVAIWHSFRMALRNLTLVATYNGLSDGAGNDCYIRYLAGTDTTFQLVTNGGATLTDLVTAPIADVFNTFDIVLMPGQFAAAWVDGNGPYITTTGIPATGTAIRIDHAHQTLTGAATAVLMDWTHLESFLEPVHPTLLYR